MAKKNLGDLDAFKSNQEVATVDTTKKMRVGIIGTGWIAHAHIQSYLNQPDVELVGGCDLIPGKAAAFFKQYNVENVKTDYKDHTEFLADKSLKLDAVSICTYNRQHVNCAIAAMEAGLDVLLEKPMSVTLDEAVELVRAEKRTGRVLSIGFQPRMDANMKKIKESPASWATFITSRPAAAVAAVSPPPSAPPSSRTRRRVWALWRTSAATRWIWCSTPSAIRSR